MYNTSSIIRCVHHVTNEMRVFQNAVFEFWINRVFEKYRKNRVFDQNGSIAEMRFLKNSVFERMVENAVFKKLGILEN